MNDEREARAKALADKRKKLEELRNRKKNLEKRVTPASPRRTATTAAPVKRVAVSVAAAAAAAPPSPTATTPRNNNNNSIASVAATPPLAPTGSTPTNLTDVDPSEFDSFVDGLLAEPQGVLSSLSGLPGGMGSAGAAAAAAATPAAGGAGVGGGVAAATALSLDALTLSTSVSDVWCAPRSTATYDRGTQTDAASTAPSSPSSPRHHAGRVSSLSLEAGTGLDGDDKAMPGSPARVSASGDGGGDGDGDGAGAGGAVAPPPMSPRSVEAAMATSEFSTFFERSTRIVERALSQLDEYDVMVDYVSNTETKTDDKASLLRKYAVLEDDRRTRHRTVTGLHWSPHHKELLAASYGSWDGHAPQSSSVSSGAVDGLVLVWSAATAGMEYVFTCPSPVLAVRFHEFMPNCLIAGTYSGQIVMWDMRAKSSPVQRSALSASGHTHPVYSLAMAGSSNSNTLVTASTGGRLCTWNTAQLMEPLTSTPLRYPPVDTVGVSQVDVASTALALPHGETNSFVVGSEDGSIYDGQMHGRKAGINDRYDAHDAPVTSLQFHPSAPLLLTSSLDWSVRVWKDFKPVLKLSGASDYVYDACWSPTHPAVMATADGTGSIDVWNLSRHKFNSMPACRETVSDVAINRLLFNEDGRLLAAGDSGGRVVLNRVAADAVSASGTEIAGFEHVIRHNAARYAAEEAAAAGAGK